MPRVGDVKLIAWGANMTESESTALEEASVSTWPAADEAVARFTKALPAVSPVDMSPMMLKVALAPLARLMPVQANWPGASSSNVVPPIELTAESATNPPSTASETVALVAGDGPLLVSVMV